MESLELDDVQGIIVRGYGTLRGAAYVMLQVRDPSGARRWLGEIADEIQDGVARPPSSCANVAFTYAGLEALGLDADALATFSLEFRDGMIGTDHRRRVLGDVGENAPEQWRWGSPGGPAIHLMLMLYSPDDAALEPFLEGHRNRFRSSGLEEVVSLPTIYLPDRKEHFGFRDGVGQPVIAGYKKGPPGNSIRAGEFVFGYEDEYGALPPTPTVAAEKDPGSLLAEHPEDGSRKDLGKNGTYLVVRQLEQDVAAFWATAARATRGDGGADAAERTRLASKMVGRWPSGAPLLLSPEQDDPSLADADDFVYHATDPHGDRCPFGSHIRRTNPRDSLEPDPGSEKSLEVGKRHRIIRRGRAYGRPLAASMDPDDLASAPDDGAERGLHFICVNTNLRRQFEFIQHTWVNNPKFSGLYDDADPLIGEHDPEGKGRKGVFTVPGEPVRTRVTELERFVRLRGGSYFFLPGKRALSYLAGLG